MTTEDGINVPAIHAEELRTAQFREHPCTLVAYHAPTPVMTEYHHTRPVFLQDRLYGRIVYGPDKWVCSNCHDAIHAWLYHLLGMWERPTYMGRAARLEAERTFEWYRAEKMRIDGAPLSASTRKEKA